MKNLSPIFAERLRALRGDKGASAFAREIGCANPSTYFYWEKGRVPHSSLVKAIADHCGVTVDWLLGRGEADAYAQPDTPPASRLLTRDPPPLVECRYPTDCNLPARLENMEHDLAEVKSKIDTLCGLLGGVLAKGLDETHTKRKAG